MVEVIPKPYQEDTWRTVLSHGREKVITPGFLEVSIDGNARRRRVVTGPCITHAPLLRLCLLITDTARESPGR